jgi:amino acid transporter, AAT family
MPAYSLIVSGFGLAIAAYLSVSSPDKAGFSLFKIAFFDGLVVWMLILANVGGIKSQVHGSRFPPSPIRTPGVPFTPIVTILALVGMLLAAFRLDLGVAWKAGMPYSIAILIIYRIVARCRAREPVAKSPIEAEL